MQNVLHWRAFAMRAYWSRWVVWRQVQFRTKGRALVVCYGLKTAVIPLLHPGSASHQLDQKFTIYTVPCISVGTCRQKSASHQIVCCIGVLRQSDSTWGAELSPAQHPFDMTKSWCYTCSSVNLCMLGVTQSQIMLCEQCLQQEYCNWACIPSQAETPKRMNTSTSTCLFRDWAWSSLSVCMPK